MAKWKKGFRKLPSSILAQLKNCAGNEIMALAGKKITREEVESGIYNHLRLTPEKLTVGNSWELLPEVGFGTSSKRNSEGWTDIRKDLPKYTKNFYREIQNFGDGARNGWSTVAIPREVYERDVTPPYLFHIKLSIKEQLLDGRYGIVFSVGEVLSKNAPDFDKDLLFAINLLQENTGVSGVVKAENPDFVFNSQLAWDVFPPGDVTALVKAISGRQGGHADAGLDKLYKRLELFEKFKPIEYLRGLGGNDQYIGAKYADDLVVFENFKYGNALYVLYEDWKVLSQKSRSELLRMSSKNFDKIVHKEGWEEQFDLLMQNELVRRGLRARVQRPRRRRR